MIVADSIVAENPTGKLVGRKRNVGLTIGDALHRLGRLDPLLDRLRPLGRGRRRRCSARSRSRWSI